MDYLRSDEPRRRRLQSDPRRRRARHPADNAGGWQFRRDGRRLYRMSVEVRVTSTV